jgi:hypothetical protein
MTIQCYVHVLRIPLSFYKMAGYAEGNKSKIVG